MVDLTVLFLTVNRVPKQWAEYHWRMLLEATEGYKIIKLEQEASTDKSNIFKQMLKGARMAKSKYIAIAEDDTLYPREHFHDIRPGDDEFGYNLHRWWLHTWDEPVYHTKKTYINATLIAPRELLIEALEERSHLGLDCEIGKCEARYGLKPRKVRELYSNVGVVQFDHDYFAGSEEPGAIEKRHTKRPKPIKAYDIPHWGNAIGLRKHFA